MEGKSKERHITIVIPSKRSLYLVHSLVPTPSFLSVRFPVPPDDWAIP